ncbi:trans-sulfuration enzyme family protein [Alkalibacter saccharofermentans]|uniref:cysteine-S-conjugate beta-lyase n=1 Tax=Alkalibacter saccharofermentans DSM 14828 TaxID=1120975 RepID=A0A1M4TLY4_9FIRM|nr:aminotransferase class I/II-fold pyridoxal phosphate-dependent enzyme [Alkalibacter saccharofermentans]SHE45415.1 cystathionine beta-lyase [Alkalibacter saccharofermentans DSM 14828]
MDFSTKLIRNGFETDKYTGALSIPIYQASTYSQKSADCDGEYEYSRSQNPTREALEKTIALLENGTNGYAFSSGMAATSSVLSIFSQGDHLLVCKDVYGGTYRVASGLFPNFGIETTFVDMTDIEEIKRNIKTNTKGIYLETPSNPLMKVTDIKKVASIAKSKGIITMLDNTFMSPYLQRPLDLGVDIVIHSATKFIGGHSDVLGGLAVVKDKALAKRIHFVQMSFGAVLGPQDCWLLLRGLKTLKVRMDYQQESAKKIALWLKNQEAVEKVYYPGLEDHQDKEIHDGQSFGPGAVLSFETKTDKAAKDFLNKVESILAVSLGGVETIVSYPTKMSHGSMPKEVKSDLGISDKLIRISVGLEDTGDLIADFEQALNSD